MDAQEKSKSLQKRGSISDRLKKMFKRRNSAYEVTPIQDDGEIKDIGSPTGFQRNVHVGYENGKFVGLPAAWEMLLKGSNITYVLSHFLLS